MTIWISKVLGPIILVFSIPMIVTLMGWLLLLGGAFRVGAPQVAGRIGTAMLGQPKLLRAIGVLWALLGAVLTYKGYA